MIFIQVLIDIGNTKTKIYTYKKKLKFLFKYDTFKLNEIENVKFIINKFNKDENITFIFSSVVEKVFNSFEKIINLNKNYSIFNLKYKHNLYIKLDTEENHKIGNDIISVSNFYTQFKNRLIIDMGTCNKYILILDNVLKGIIISPGINLKANSLYNETALLPKIKVFETDKILGKNTKDCLNIGIYQAQVAEIKYFIEKIKIKHPSIEKVFITGGNFNLFINQFMDIEYKPDLLVEGLLNIYNLNNIN